MIPELSNSPVLPPPYRSELPEPLTPTPGESAQRERANCFPPQAPAERRCEGNANTRYLPKRLLFYWRAV